MHKERQFYLRRKVVIFESAIITACTSSEALKLAESRYHSDLYWVRESHPWAYRDTEVIKVVDPHDVRKTC